ncbi:50S ribosomal protein L31 [Clarias magur]|uniref:50S ribosomal protein L31 n=1 Tax=Clarias magur TaxID=1594786 RepID=A0A8J4UCC5_CLAMG|nr:50S ribosomal protein L31 [Clarias magur]
MAIPSTVFPGPRQTGTFVEIQCSLCNNNTTNVLQSCHSYSTGREKRRWEESRESVLLDRAALRNGVGYQGRKTRDTEAKRAREDEVYVEDLSHARLALVRILLSVCITS